MIVALTTFLAACATPPLPAPVRDATPVDASFDQTWNAVIDHFAATNVPIQTIEKASGIIATARLGVDIESAARFADCGKTALLAVRYASDVVYNVLVRGDSNTSTVRVTATWMLPGVECTTKGIWETDTELAVKARAEAGG